MGDYDASKESAKVRALRMEHDDELMRHDLADPSRSTVRLAPTEAPSSVVRVQPMPSAQSPAVSPGGMPDHSPQAMPVMPPRAQAPSPMPDISQLAAQVPQGAWVGDPRGQQMPARQPLSPEELALIGQGG